MHQTPVPWQCIPLMDITFSGTISFRNFHTQSRPCTGSIRSLFIASVILFSKRTRVRMGKDPRLPTNARRPVCDLLGRDRGPDAFVGSRGSFPIRTRVLLLNRIT